MVVAVEVEVVVTALEVVVEEKRELEVEDELALVNVVLPSSGRVAEQPAIPALSNQDPKNTTNKTKNDQNQT